MRRRLAGLFVAKALNIPKDFGSDRLVLGQRQSASGKRSGSGVSYSSGHEAALLTSGDLVKVIGDEQYLRRHHYPAMPVEPSRPAIQPSRVDQGRCRSRESGGRHVLGTASYV
jgi:hypothetical protein